MVIGGALGAQAGERTASDLDRFVLDLLLKYGLRARDQWNGGYLEALSPGAIRERKWEREQQEQIAIQVRKRAAKRQGEAELQTLFDEFNEWFTRNR